MGTSNEEQQHSNNNDRVVTSYDSAASWTKVFTENDDLSYPAEGVIRIFKGRFPDLHMPRPVAENEILDLGCGDGRHLPFFSSLGMRPFATEISDEIVAQLRERMGQLGVDAEIRVGHAAAIPFADGQFDYLLSWNSCYYMSLGDGDFEHHVMEMARVIKPGGWIVCSVPTKDAFIFKDSEPHERLGYRVICNDYFDGMRNGEVMRCFEERSELEEAFAGNFTSFCHADLNMNWFGLSYRWHVFAAQRI